MRYWKHAGIVLLLLGLPFVIPIACRNPPALEAPGIAEAPAGSIPQRTKEENAALGRQHKTAWELYQALKAEAKGVITQVLVENAKPVEFGQPLFKLRPT